MYKTKQYRRNWGMCLIITLKIKYYYNKINSNTYRIIYYSFNEVTILIIILFLITINIVFFKNRFHSLWQL